MEPLAHIEAVAAQLSPYPAPSTASGPHAMADAISASGALVTATAAKAEKILSSAVQLIGDAPADVQQALTQIQALSASIARLFEQFDTHLSTEWADNWLSEASRIIDAAATETNALYGALVKWDKQRSANQIQTTWPAFRSAITNDQLTRVSRRVDLVKSSMAQLTSAASLTSTPAVNVLVGRARDITNSLVSDQASDHVPTTSATTALPPPLPIPTLPHRHSLPHAHTHHHNGTIMPNHMMIPANMVNGTAGGYTLIQSPPHSPQEQPPPYEQTVRGTNRTASHQQVGYFLVSAAAHAQQEAGVNALRQELKTKTRRITELETELAELRTERDAGVAEMLSLKDEISTRDRRIAELEGDLAAPSPLERRSSMASADVNFHQDQVFRDLVNKYKGVKKLYFEAKGEISNLNRQVSDLKGTTGHGSVESSPLAGPSSAAEAWNTTDGRDKIIEAWKQRYEELSTEQAKQTRLQQQREGEIREWREKYDTLVAQQLSLDDVARTAEERLGEMTRLQQEVEVAEGKLRNQGDEISASHKALSDAQKMLEENNTVYAGKLAALEHELERIQTEMEHRLTQAEAERATQVEAERVKKAKAVEAVGKLTALWQEAQKVLVESGMSG